MAQSPPVFPALTAWLVLVSCVVTDTTSVDSVDTADTDTGTDSDSAPPPVADLGRVGSGVYDGASYVGTEDIAVVTDDGDGDDICRIRFALTSQGPQRTDCPDCAWAFDLVLSDAELLVDERANCLALLDLGVTQVSDLDGTAVAYGYQAKYIGHATVLYVDWGSGTWEPVAHALLIEKTGEFSYSWSQGDVAY